MEILRTPGEARQYVSSLAPGRRSVGLVPTMGALHAGHLSLVQMSRDRCDATIATIFVNPTQFGPNEDLEKYPRTLERDLELLGAEGVAAVFTPESNAMYPEGFSTFVQPPSVAEPLEGVCRPGHFRGVATVVLKLFHAVPATHAFFGRKDYQQLKVIEAMTRDLGLAIEIIPGDTIREVDGLALSSRNRYLDQAERERALLIRAALAKTEAAVLGGEREIDNLESMMRETLNPAGAADTRDVDAHRVDTRGVDKIDYAVVVDAETLEPIRQLDRRAVALIAAHVGQTRLIDNQVLTDSA